MAKNKKVRVSTLDDWYAALSKMYNDLKTENKDRYDKDVGKDYDASSKLTPGTKATAKHINQVINSINNLNGKDSNGNIPTDKDDLKVYFWYSDWNIPPGEIKVGDTKIKIKSQLKKEIDTSITELKRICVNNSKEKVLANTINPDLTYSKNECIDYTCTDNVKTCIDNATVTHATEPSNSKTYHSTAYDSKTVKNTINTPATTYSNTPNATVTKVTSNSNTTTYSQSCPYNSQYAYGQTTYNVNCSQYNIANTGNTKCVNNSNWKTKPGVQVTHSKSTSYSNNANYSKTAGNSYSVVTSNSINPSDSKKTVTTTNSTAPYNSVTSHSTTPSNTVTPNTTIISYSKDLKDSKTTNTVKINNCDKCEHCAQDIRCQTYNIGYSVRIKEDGTYETFKSDTVNLDKYLYIK